jgi:spermidine synthase
VLASGFLFIDHAGLPGTILLAGVMNILLALVVWALAKGRDAEPPSPASAAMASPEARGFGTAILVAALFTGAASFIHEITWIRMLSLGLGASTHSFEVMLAAFIFGMSAGALWLRRRLDGIADTTGWLVGVLVAKAVLAVLAIYVYTGVLDFVRWMMSATARTDAGYTVTTLAGLAASMAVMVPTAFCAGMTLPLATLALTRRGYGESAIGRVYAANTAGCILGAAFATHVGMEWLGVKGLTGAGALVDAAVAVLLLSFAGGLAGRRFAAGAVSAAGVLAVVAFIASDLDQLKMASGVFRYGEFIEPGEGRVTFYRDGKTATISVVEVKQLVTIRTNGKPDAGVQYDTALPVTGDEPTMALLAALPLALRPEAESIANIGFGSGLTTHALLGSPRVKRVDTIEIEPAMVAAARRFNPLNARAYTDPRSHIHFEDAKTFFAAQGARYDAIVSEPSNPWVSGVSTLFSEEFYGQVKRHLKDDGVLVQWIHAYELDLPLLASIFRALGQHFDDYAVYSWMPGDLYVVASPRGKLPALSPRIFTYPDVVSDLALLGIKEVADLQSLRLGGRAALDPIFAATRANANSDYFPILDQQAPRARFRSDNVFELSEMREAREPLLALLDQETRTPRTRLDVSGRTQPPRIARARAGLEAIAIFTGQSAGKAPSLPDGLRNEAIVARSLLAGCDGAQFLWLQSLGAVVGAASPYLEASELEGLFRVARASVCARTLDDIGRRRLDLMEAFNRRDSAAIAAAASYLLENARYATERERSAYLAATIVALLHQGRDAEAHAIAAKYASTLSARESKRLQVRLAFAQLAARGRR